VVHRSKRKGYAMHESFLVCSSTPMSCVSFVKYSAHLMRAVKEHPLRQHRRLPMQAQAECSSSSVPIALSIFGVSTFKGLLSIPSDGRGARRPQGQSFRKSVGPRPSLNQRLTEKSSIDDIFLSLIRLTYDGEFSTDSPAVDNK